MSTEAIIIPVISLFVGVFGGLVGAYVGMKVGLTRLETWREIIDGNINRLTVAVAAHQEDFLIHDMEIGELFRIEDMDRVVRQRMR